MKRKLITLIMATALMSATLAGCGNTQVEETEPVSTEEPATEEETPTAEEEPVEEVVEEVTEVEEEEPEQVVEEKYMSGEEIL